MTDKTANKINKCLQGSGYTIVADEDLNHARIVAKSLLDTIKVQEMEIENLQSQVRELEFKLKLAITA